MIKAEEDEIAYEGGFGQVIKVKYIPLTITAARHVFYLPQMQLQMM